MTLVQDVFGIRSRQSYSHDDIKVWAIDVFRTFFGIEVESVATEVVIKSETKGRADIIVGDYIGIEVKKSMEKEIDDALIQVRRLLKKFEDDGSPSAIGIATDGEIWNFYVLVQDALFRFYSFKIVPHWSDDQFRDSLWEALIVLRAEKTRRSPTAEAVSEAFRPRGPVFEKVRLVLLEEIAYLLKEKPIEFTSKFIPWLELFDFTYNNFSSRCEAIGSDASDTEKIATLLEKRLPKRFEYSKKVIQGAVELFVRHTYLAILAKLLCAVTSLGEHEVASKLLDDPKLLITGEILVTQNVFLAESNDFFSWVAAGRESRKIIGTFYNSLKRFSSDFTDDVFRHLYESLVDRDTRHELGEFFTPRWLAQLIVRDTIIKSSQSVLDPACGSGTFLIAALNRKVALALKEKSITPQMIQDFLDQLWGIDINPLSVILARTNIYLTLTSLLKNKSLPSEIRPRVYVADTFILPRFTKEYQRILDEEPHTEIISVPVTDDIHIPIHLKITVDEMTALVENVGQRMNLKKDLTEEDLKVVDQSQVNYVSALYSCMKSLKRQYGDNLWRFILRNYCVPPLLRERFDVVVGNPPWLIFREAKANIQFTIEHVAKKFNVIPDVKVKTSFNLAVAFFLTATQFLKRGGKIGFVLPLSVIESAAHLPFIKAMESGKLGNLLYIYDLSKIEPPPFPHTLAPCVIVGKV